MKISRVNATTEKNLGTGKFEARITLVSDDRAFTSLLESEDGFEAAEVADALRQLADSLD